MRVRQNKMRALRRGMTLVELSIGILVTSLVLGALAALWFAVARTWTNTSSSQNVALTGSMIVGRLESTLRTAKYICQFTAGSKDGSSTPAACVLYWKGETWTDDGAVQIAELALIEHDPVSKRLYLYQAIPAASMTPSQLTRAAGIATWSDLSNSNTPGTFKGYDFVRATVFAEAVSGAAFNVPTARTGLRPSMEFTLTISRAGGNSLVYGLSSLRAPTTRPL